MLLSNYQILKYDGHRANDKNKIKNVFIVILDFLNLCRFL